MTDCEIEIPDIVLTADCHDPEALENFFAQVKKIMSEFDMEVVVMTKNGVIDENSNVK